MKISKETKVGLFMVIGLVLLYLGFNFLKGIDFFDSNRKYLVIYENVDKLMTSNPVYLNGYSVGRVDDISIIRGNKVLVQLSINSEVVITDSTVAVLSGDFLGNKYIQLNIPADYGRVLDQGDTIKSQLEKGLADLLEKADPVADNIQATLRNLNAILSNLASHSGNMDTIFQRFKEVPYRLNTALSNTNEVVLKAGTDLHELSNTATSAISDMKPIIANVRAFTDSLQSIKANQTLEKIQETLAKINSTLDQFNEGESTLGKLMTEDSLYVNLNTLVRNLDTLVTHFNTNPKHFLAPLGKSRTKIERDRRKEGE